MRTLISAGVCLLIGLTVACGNSPPGKGGGEVESAQAQPPGQAAVKFRVETVVSNLEVPWSIVWAPDGRMFFTERPGRVRVYEKGQLAAAPLVTISDVEESGESGLMSMAPTQISQPIAGFIWHTRLAQAASGLELFGIVKLPTDLPSAL